MPKTVAPLTATSLRNRLKVMQAQADAANTTKRITDGQGLCVEVRALRPPVWIWRYTPPGGGGRKPFTIGPVERITLETAREVRRALQDKLFADIDPNLEKKQAKAGFAKVATASALGVTVPELTMPGPTVTEIAHEFLLHKAAQRLPTPVDDNGQPMDRVYVADIRRAFEADLLPTLGHRKAAVLTEADIHSVLKPIAARGAHVQLRRFHMWLRDMYQFARTRPEHPIAKSPVPLDTKDYPAPPRAKQRPHLRNPKDFAQMLRDIDAHTALIPRNALLIHARTGVRPIELMNAEWPHVGSEFWTVTVALAEVDFEHLVPITPQTQTLFDNLRGLHPTIICPGRGGKGKMSEATLNAALESLGYKGKAVTHGFRHTMSTLLNEMGWPHRLVDVQLSHMVAGSEGVYNKAQYLMARKHMMACWSDYIDALIDKDSGADTVLPMRWYFQWLKTHPLDEFVLADEQELFDAQAGRRVSP